MGIQSDLSGITVLCDWEDVQYILSHYGAAMDVDDTEISGASYDEDDLKRRVLEFGYFDFRRLTANQIIPANLTGEARSNARMDCSILSAHHAATRRGNDAPAELQAKYDECKAWLTRVGEGAQYPGMGKNPASMMRMQNHTWDMGVATRYGNRQPLRTDKQTSSKLTSQHRNVNIPDYNRYGY